MGAKLSSRGSMPQTLSCICRELDICDVRTSYVSRRQCTSSDGDDVAPCLLRGLATPALLVRQRRGMLRICQYSHDKKLHIKSDIMLLVVSAVRGPYIYVYMELFEDALKDIVGVPL
ncbi:hypothetical protein Tco_1469363 [Tanacetum coccineum]